MLSSDSRKTQVKEEDQPKKLAPIISQAAAWGAADQQGVGSADPELTAYIRGAPVESTREHMRSSPMPRPAMLYSSNSPTPNMRDYRMMAAGPYPPYPATSGAMPGYPPDRRYYEPGQVAFKFPGMPSPLHPKSGNGVPYPPNMRSAHPSQFSQSPQSQQILPNGASSTTPTPGRFPYAQQMLGPAGYAMSGPIAKSIAPMRENSTGQLTTAAASSAAAASSSPKTENGSPSEPSKPTEQQQRPPSSGNTPIAARPSSTDGVPNQAQSQTAQQQQKQQQLQYHAAEEQQKPSEGNNVPRSSTMVEEFVHVIILRPNSQHFTSDDVVVGHMTVPPQRAVHDYRPYPIRYNVDRSDPEKSQAAKDTAIDELRKQLVAQLNNSSGYLGKSSLNISGGTTRPLNVPISPPSSVTSNPLVRPGEPIQVPRHSGNSKPPAMFAMPPSGMYAPVSAYGMVPGQDMTALPSRGDGELPETTNHDGRHVSSMPGRVRPRMWPGHTTYSKPEYESVTAPTSESEQATGINNTKSIKYQQADRGMEEPEGVRIPHKKRTLAQSMRDWKRFAKESNSGAPNGPSMDEVVELLGCGIVSPKSVHIGNTDDIADIKKLTASFQKKYAKQLQVNDADDENDDLQGHDRGRSTRATRSTRASHRRDKTGDADESVAENSKEEQDNSDLWVQCDKCANWRRLPPKSDPNHPKSLPNRWYCRMNTWDLARADCSVPQEQYNAHPNARPLSDRARKIRVLVRRLKAMDRFESRASNRTQFCVGRDRYYGNVDWIRCCNPACGKWRATLRSIDAQALKEKHPTWFCWMNSWDDARASCAAPQDNSHLRSYAEAIVIEDDQSEEQQTLEPREDDYMDNSQIQGISSKGRIVRSRWNTRRRR